MMSDLETYTRLNSRRTSILEIGGFRPTLEPTASHFGLTPMGLPGEQYPCNELGIPLEFICQMNLIQAPFVPEILADVKFLTFFVDTPNRFIRTDSSSDTWCIRAYNSLEGLVALELPEQERSDSELQLNNKGFEARWIEATDHPIYDDPDLILSDGFDNEDIHLENQRHTKIGGYPSNIQSEVIWAAYVKDENDVWVNPLQGKVGFAFQIDSEEKVGLNWGDSGMVYIGRGISEDTRGQWFVTCQMY